MNIIKGAMDKVASRKLAMTAAAGAAAATGTIELTWPMAVVAVLISQGRRWWIRGASDERDRPAPNCEAGRSINNLFHSESQHHPRVTLEGASITSKSLELILTNAGLAPTPANSSEFTKAS